MLIFIYKQNYILRQNNHKTIGYLSMRYIETGECEAPYSCLPKKYSDTVNDILGQQKHQHFSIW